MPIKISDAIAEFLKEKKIKHAFGIIGAGNAHLFDSIDQLGYTEIICVHHEQAAGMAINTYYRATGNMSACLITTGGGSTNAVTGVVSAWMDSIPTLFIAGNEKAQHCQETNPLRIWGVQGYDSVAMVKKVTKWAHRINKPETTLYDLERGYLTALSDRPGPVWLEIPMDIQSTRVDQQALIPFTPAQEHTPALFKNASTDSLEQDIDKIFDLLKQSTRPLFWLGHGIRLAGAAHQVLPLLEQTQIPALVSWQGLDLAPSDHPLICGRAGVYGQRHANFILQNCDLLICIGTRLAYPQVGYDLSEFARAAKIVSVDIDPLELEKFKQRLTLPLCYDAKLFLDALINRVQYTTYNTYEPWLKQCQAYKEKYPVIEAIHQDTKGYINSYAFMQRLSEDIKPDQFIVTDMGTALLSGHQALTLRHEQRLLTSTGLGEMGFGLPAAIGVSIARNHGEVLCLNCDGGMMMNLQELQTIVHHQLPIKIIIFNNDGYLMIKHTQKNLFKGRYVGTNKTTGVSCPDFSKLAAAFGIPSYQIKTWNDYTQHIQTFLQGTGPAICEVFMDPEQPFLPKLGVSIEKDGTLISPPLEDLSPFIPRKELQKEMIIGMHPKSEKISV